MATTKTQRHKGNAQIKGNARFLCVFVSSLGHDEIDEYAFVVVPQVGQVVGEVGEVVADADLHVLADVTIDRGQRAAAALTDIPEVEHSRLGQALPALEEPPAEAQHRELRDVVEELGLPAIQARLSQ